MFAELEKMPIPGWLSKIRDAGAVLPLQELLTDSLYYPACGFDGNPVRLLNGNVVSFVYADYQTREHDLCEELERRGFRGYTPVFKRPVAAEEWYTVAGCRAYCRLSD